MTVLLEVGDLHVRFGADVHALRGVSFTVDHGESLAIVGESGAGKSTLALCAVGAIRAPEATGSVRVAGLELIGAAPERLRAVRWETVALTLQQAPLNPVVTLGAQVAEPLRERRGLSRSQAARRSGELAEEVALEASILERFPHELSGGERRRAALPMALALDPALLILDEPTAGLDPATRHDLLERIAGLAAARGLALVVITHDLPAAARLADRVVVLYAGTAVEAGPAAATLGRPAHPYSSGLVNAFPVMSTTKDLRPIRGEPADARGVPSGCVFAPRCTQAETVCHEIRPALEPSRGRLVACHFGGLKALLTVIGLHKSFRVRGPSVRALTDVSLVVHEGESVGVVGPSGSGKTTLARIVSGHLRADAGTVALDAPGARSRVQLVMQDPWDALSPRLPVLELVREPLDIARAESGARRDARVAEQLDAVGLPATGPFLEARVHELSGGQLQRVALARALIARPKLLVADEPTSMLDASEQARLLGVLRERQVEMGLGLVLISHDIAVVRKVTDRIVVLDGGRVVEEGSSAQVSGTPRSATARRLVETAPVLGGDAG